MRLLNTNAMAVTVLCALTLGIPGSWAARAADALTGPAAPHDLPRHVHLKTAQETFNHQYYLAVRMGRIFMKRNESTQGVQESWSPMPSAAGLPPIAQISADGDNLIAVARDRRVYYMKFHDFDWMRRWGPLMYKLFLPTDARMWAISHRGPESEHYEDIAGNEHPIHAGVTTLYALSRDGLRIRYADPWLPSHFNYRICGPERGRFKAVSLGASSSTLFVMDRSGRMFTRLADFDTVGDNPVLKYTYSLDEPDGTRKRALPGEPWREQPPIPGRHTTLITIHQTGKGNASRELRVAGVDEEGRSGHWQKPIHGERWEFVPTNRFVAGPFVDPDLPVELGPELERDFEGTLKGVGVRGKLRVSVLGFNPDCGAARLRISTGDYVYEGALHTRRTEMFRDEARTRIKYRATFVVPDEMLASDDPVTRRLVAKAFGRERFVDFKLVSKPGSLYLKTEDGVPVYDRLEMNLSPVRR